MKKKRSLILALSIIMLLSLYSIPSAAAYQDVPEEKYYAGYLESLTTSGVIQEKDFFYPDNACTRSVFVTWLWRAAGSPAAAAPCTLSDVEAGQDYTDAVAWAQESGVVKGYYDGTFGINDTVTRAQMVTFLYRWAQYMGCYDVSQQADLTEWPDVDELPSHAQESAAWAVAGGALLGTNDGTLNPNGLASRAHAVAFIGRASEITREHTWDAGKVTQSATCTRTGIRTYTCTGCGETMTETIARKGHRWGEWTDNGDGTHSRVCSRNSGHTQTASHAYTSDDDVTCDTCGYERSVHTCGNGTPVAGQAATCTEDGWQGYYQCYCEKLYADAACNDEITDLAAWKAGAGRIAASHVYGTLIEATEAVHTQSELKGAVAAHYFCDVCDTYFDADKEETTLAGLTGTVPVHSYGAWINTNADKHWKVCSCGLKSEENDHSYADAEDTTCDTCGYERTIAHDHAFANTWSYDETNHWYASTCGHEVTSGLEAHHGGTATCTAKAVCEDCGQAYGSFADHAYGTLIEATEVVHTQSELKGAVAAHYFCDVCDTYFDADKEETTLAELTGEAPVHSYGAWINTDADKHWKVCSCGLKSEENDHSYTDAEDTTCDTCGYERTIAHDHAFANTWSYDETNHWYASTCGHEVTSGLEAHHGGTATCSAKAVCEDCGQAYGSFASHAYGTLIEATEAVHTQSELKGAVAAHYFCDVCDTYFDADKEETTLAGLTGTVPVHSYGAWINTDADKHWKVCSCGLKSEENDHSYTDAEDTTCDTCGYERTIAHDHAFANTWSYDEANHWYASTCGHEVTSGLEAHHGGTATCSAKAVCEDCGQAYGSFADHAYGTLIEATEAVHTQSELKGAVAAHYFCDVCDTYFDADQVATTLEALTGAAPVHTWNNGELTAAATAVAAGTITYTCEICETTKTEAAPIGSKITTRADLEEAIVTGGWAYYMKGAKVQYDSMAVTIISQTYGGKFRLSPEESPEYGTSDTINYSVCTDFVHKSYLESLNKHILNRRFSPWGLATVWLWRVADNQPEMDFVVGGATTTDPVTENDADIALLRWVNMTNMAASTKESIKTDNILGVYDSSAFSDFTAKTSSTADDGLVFKKTGNQITDETSSGDYTVDEYGYYLDGEATTAAVAKEYVLNYIKENNYANLRPGDVTVYNTHALLYIGNGYVLDCSGSKYNISTGTDSVEENGSVYGRITKVEKTAERANTDYVILRPLDQYAKDYDGDPGNDIIDIEIPEDTQSRLEYPAIEIDRTVDISPYGTATKGENLTYTIQISNRSTEAKYVTWSGDSDGTAYENLVITETIPAGTEFVSASDGIEPVNGVLTWTKNIAAGESVTLSYVVKVTAEIGETITNDGGYVAKIPSNSISNTVGGAKLGSAEQAVLESIAESDPTDWTYSTDLAFAEEIYAALGQSLDLPSIKDIVDNIFTLTTSESRATVSPWFYQTAEDDYSLYMLQNIEAGSPYAATRSMLVEGYYGGYRFYFPDTERQYSNINEFRFDYLEPGDILVYVTAETDSRDQAIITGSIASTRVLVYAGNETLLEMTSSGTGKIYQGSAAQTVLTATFKKTNDLFFALRPSQANVLVSHTWDDGTTTPADCGVDGSIVYQCQDAGCNATRTIVIPKVEHEWSTTCTDNGDGTHIYKCANNAEHTKAAEHIWGSGVQIGDTTWDIYTCTAAGCGATKTDVARLTSDQISALQAQSYDGVSAVANGNACYPLSYARNLYKVMMGESFDLETVFGYGEDNVYGLGADENITTTNVKKNRGTAAKFIAEVFKKVGEGSTYSITVRQYVYRDGSQYVQTPLSKMLVEDYYGGSWIRTEKDGTQLTNAVSEKALSIKDLEPGDLLVLAKADASGQWTLWAAVYQGNGKFLICATYTDTDSGAPFAPVTATSAYRGTMTFDVETGTLTGYEFKTVGGSALDSSFTEAMCAQVGSYKYTDFLTKDPFSGSTWHYFFALRPCMVAGNGTTEPDVGSLTGTVTYQYEGDVPEGAPAVPSAANYVAGASVTVATAPTLEGYVFSGWSSENVTISDGSFTMPDADVTLTGSWMSAMEATLKTLTYTDVASKDIYSLMYAHNIYSLWGVDLEAAFGINISTSTDNKGTAATFIGRIFNRYEYGVKDDGTKYGAGGRCYWLDEESAAANLRAMLIENYYGGCWIEDSEGTRMTSAAADASIGALQPGDILVAAGANSKEVRPMWVSVYQGDNTFLVAGYGENKSNYRGTVVFNENKTVKSSSFVKGVSGAGSAATMSSEIADYEDFLTRDLISGGEKLYYFFALRPNQYLDTVE